MRLNLEQLDRYYGKIYVERINHVFRGDKKKEKSIERMKEKQATIEMFNKRQQKYKGDRYGTY